jgi:hypothetical protein
MTDHELPPQDPAPHDPADARDEAAAALLAVPPLDEVTRRRLVGTALAAADTPAAGMPGTRRRSRLVVAIPVAAAIVLGIAIGSIVVTRPDDPTTTVASPAPSTALEAPAPQQASGSSDGGAAADTPALSASVRALGDLGDVADSEALRAAVTEALAGDAAERKSADAGGVACGTTAPETLELVNITAIGTGINNSAPVTVFVGTDAQGAQVAVELVAEFCDPVLRTVLGP